MKRLYDGETEISGLKKGKPLDAIAQNSGVLDDDDAAAAAAKLNNSNEWDFDINFDLIFGNGEGQSGINFDLNAPMVGRIDNSRKEVEIIDIASDDSDSDVEIVGFNIGSVSAKGKGIEVFVPNYRFENLDLGLGLAPDMDCYVVGETSMVNNNAANVFDPWLSLGDEYPLPLPMDFWAEREDSVEIIEPENNDFVHILPWQPVVEPIPDFTQVALGQAEQAGRYRRETARRLARMDDHDMESVSQKESPLTSTAAVQQLGSSPGPFSEALERIRQRTLKRAAEDLIQWVPSAENSNDRITAPAAAPLLDLSLRALAQNAEGLVSLELVPDFLRRKLVDVLCDMGKMDSHVLKLLVEGCPTEIRVKNCSGLTEKQFEQTFRSCQTKNLRVLQLDLCGQFMYDIVLRDTFAPSSSSFSSLIILSLRGACRLSDCGLKELVGSAPKLQSINLGNCTLLTHHAIDFLASSLGPNLLELWIDECLKIDALLILPALRKFTSLEVLSVAGMETVTDEFVSEMITYCSRSIKELNLDNCLKLTDLSLKAIGSSCAGLHSLNISNLDNLTDLGVEYLANGCRSIHNFKLSRTRFSDEAVAAFLESSGGSLVELSLNNVTKVGPNTALSLAKNSSMLLSLDISWCRKISDTAIGLIVDSCSSLKLLKVFGCRQITSLFLNGYSNRLVRVIGVNLTPILDHLQLLEPEEVLLRYSPLEMHST